MHAWRWFAAVVAAAGMLASLAAPAAAQQAPAGGQDGSSSRSVAGSGAPVLAGGFVFGGRWLAAGVVSLDWDDVTGAGSYELMVRTGDGWVLLDGRSPVEGLVVEFDGSSALVAGLAPDVGEHWFAVRARNALGVSLWSPSAAVAVPEDALEDSTGDGVFDPFTAPTRSGIDLEALREAMATVTPGQADCSTAPALEVAGVTVVDAPAGLNDPDAPLTVAEVTRIAGGCVLVDYVALAGRSVAEVRALLASESSVHAVSEPLRGFAPTHDENGTDDDASHHDDGGGPQWHLTPEFTKVPGGLWDGWDASAGHEVVVAVLDTGVDVAHEDLDGQIASGRLGGCHEVDLDGHGTHVAGIVAAEHGSASTATNVHVAGVAPQAKILPVRVELDDVPACTGGGSPLTIPEAVAAAVNAGADVINMSFAGSPPGDEAGLEVGGVAIAEADAFESVLRAASMLGVVLVASAGNCGNDNDVEIGGVTMKGWQWNDCPQHNAIQSPRAVRRRDLSGCGRPQRDSILVEHRPDPCGCRRARRENPVHSAAADLHSRRHRRRRNRRPVEAAGMRARRSRGGVPVESRPAHEHVKDASVLLVSRDPQVGHVDGGAVRVGGGGAHVESSP